MRTGKATPAAGKQQRHKTIIDNLEQPTPEMVNSLRMLLELSVPFDMAHLVFSMHTRLKMDEDEQATWGLLMIFLLTVEEERARRQAD